MPEKPIENAQNENVQNENLSPEALKLRKAYETLPTMEEKLEFLFDFQSKAFAADNIGKPLSEDVTDMGDMLKQTFMDTYLKSKDPETVENVYRAISAVNTKIACEMVDEYNGFLNSPLLENDPDREKKAFWLTRAASPSAITSRAARIITPDLLYDAPLPLFWDKADFSLETTFKEYAEAIGLSTEEEKNKLYEEFGAQPDQLVYDAFKASIAEKYPDEQKRHMKAVENMSKDYASRRIEYVMNQEQKRILSQPQYVDKAEKVKKFIIESYGDENKSGIKDWVKTKGEELAQEKLGELSEKVISNFDTKYSDDRIATYSLMNTLLQQRELMFKHKKRFGFEVANSDEFNDMVDSLDKSIRFLRENPEALKDPVGQKQLADTFLATRHYVDEKIRKAGNLEDPTKYMPSSSMDKARYKASHGVMDAIEAALPQKMLLDYCMDKKLPHFDTDFDRPDITRAKVENLTARGLAISALCQGQRELIEQKKQGIDPKKPITIKNAISEGNILRMEKLVRKTARFADYKKNMGNKLVRNIAKFFDKDGKGALEEATKNIRQNIRDKNFVEPSQKKTNMPKVKNGGMNM